MIRLIDADDRDFRIEVRDAVWNLRDQFERLFRMRSDAERYVCLLGNDNDADRGQHSVYCRNREELTEDADTKQAESHLDQTGSNADCECTLIAQNGVAVRPTIGPRPAQ